MKLPPGPTAPRAVQGAYALLTPHRGMHRMRARYGDAFTVNVPIFGRAVVLSDPAEVRQLFQAGSDFVENIEPNLGRLLGAGSLFALTGDEHRKQRKLLVPPFHGRRLQAYELIIEQETVGELGSWPQRRPFATLPSMMRITLNAILRAVFGAQGADLVLLRDLLPRMVTLGSRLAAIPLPRTDLGRWSPWGRYWRYRRRFDGIVDGLIAKAYHEGLDERDDILATMLQSRYSDGTAMSHRDIADELLTLLVAGHETTATTLAWTIERLRRNPEVLARLTEEADAGGSAYRDATITEVQRIRPVIDLVGRRTLADEVRIGRWTLPKHQSILVSIALMHDDPSLFARPRTFDPSRFLDGKPDLYHWIPFGGGNRRCLGAAFAAMEMNVVLRTMLRDFTLEPTTAPGEPWRSRGVASAPGKGGQAVVRRRVRDSVGAAAGARS